MPPSVAFSAQSAVATCRPTLDGPPPKKRRISVNEYEHSIRQDDPHGENEDRPQETISRVPRHLLGVRPLGNLYTAKGGNIKTRCGTLAFLPDELLLQLFESFGTRDLLHLGATCKALYALTRSDELWRALFIAKPPESFSWRGSWRSTYLSLPQSLTSLPPVDCTGLYSDALYRPFQCAHTPLAPFTTSIPTSNQIPRLRDLTATSFTDEGWADRPFILTEPVKKWRAYTSWSTTSLLEQYKNTKFRAEAVDWPLATYIDYLRDCSQDESPLYLFDCAFVEKMGLRVPEDDTSSISDHAPPPSPNTTQKETPYDYIPPPTFHPDLFTTLGAQRPHHRWLILGPARSGSTFHKDPNATSAWNAVLHGAKYWIMFPSGPTIPTPPGVFVSSDQSEITAPLSIAEWLLTFHAEARRTPGCMEGVCRAGEVLYVPSGWYHLVLNLEESLAITQNFVPRAHLSGVLAFLRDRPEQVTGFKRDGPGAVADPFALFCERLEAEYGSAFVEEGLRALEEQKGAAAKGRWERLVEGDGKDGGDAEQGGFSFGFGLADDEDDNDE